MALRHIKTRTETNDGRSMQHGDWQLAPSSVISESSLLLSHLSVKTFFDTAKRALLDNKRGQNGGSKKPKAMQNRWTDPRALGNVTMRVGSISTSLFVCNKIRCPCPDCGRDDAGAMERVLQAMSEVLKVWAKTESKSLLPYVCFAGQSLRLRESLSNHSIISRRLECVQHCALNHQPSRLCVFLLSSRRPRMMEAKEMVCQNFATARSSMA
jgi:hypothetical protein